MVVCVRLSSSFVALFGSWVFENRDNARKALKGVSERLRACKKSVGVSRGDEKKESSAYFVIVSPDSLSLMPWMDALSKSKKKRKEPNVIRSIVPSLCGPRLHPGPHGRRHFTSGLAPSMYLPPLNAKTRQDGPSKGQYYT